MSVRRSRFKVAASIPVRRKPQVVESTSTAPDPEEKQKDKGDVSNSLPNELPTDSGIITDSLQSSDSPRCEVVKHVGGKEEYTASNFLNVASKENEGQVPELEGGDDFRANLRIPDTQDQRHKTPVAPLAPPPASPIKASRSRFARPALSSRRPSVHASSASESEDDSQRQQKTLKLSESLQAPENQAAVTALPPDVSEPSGNEEAAECVRLSFLPKKKAKVSNFVRKVAEARREFKRKFAEKKPDRSNLKMFDLIYYNPNSAPLKSSKNNSKPSSETIEVAPSSALEEEEVDNPGELPEESASSAPVPQVKIGANGEIILDEKSLVIETTAAKKGREALESAVTILEEGHRKTSYHGKKQSATKEWTPIETKIFYRALNCLGTDFALMSSIFPDRSRSELKNKFKREERNHGALIDRALSKPGQFNVKLLLQEVEEERKRVKYERVRQLEEKCRIDRERRLERESFPLKTASKSKCVKLLEDFVEDSPAPKGEPNEFARKPRPRRAAQQRRYMPEDFVDPFSASEEVTEETSPLLEGQTEVKIGKKGTQNKLGVNGTKVEQRPSKKGTVFRVSGDVQQKQYRPELVENADTESVVSCLSVEDIPAEEFMELLQENIQNSGRASIRVENGPAEKDCAMQVVLAAGPGKKTRRLRVVPNTGIHLHNLEEPNLTINEESKRGMEMEPVFVNDLETVYTLKPLSNQLYCPERVEPGQVETFARLTGGELKMETPHSAQINGGKPELRKLCRIEERTGRPEEDFNCHIKVEHDYVFPNENFNAMNPLSKTVRHDSRNNGNLVQNSSFEQENEYTITNLDNGGTVRERNIGGPAEPGILEKKLGYSSEPSVSAMGPVSYRMTSGLQYALIETNATLDQISLTGFRPGSFVLITTPSDKPNERECRMYEIAEKFMPDGSTVLTPLPAALCPKLMALVVSDLNNCQSI